jgi:hypothetical protein
MESTAMGAGPLTALIFVLALVVAWVGHAIGKTSERKRKEAALDEAQRKSQGLLDNLRREGQEKLDVLSKATANDLAHLKQVHSQQVEQLNRAHHAMVDSLKTKHADDIDRLNATNNANMKSVEERRQQEILDIRSETAATIATLKVEHTHAIKELASERDGLRAAKDDLQQTITELHHEIKEARMNNMFSVSKSGEKLMRVVRSVQELATELDETSLAVTGGEYSIFDAIKDQRDRETVRRLAGTYDPVDSDSDSEAPQSTGEAEGEAGKPGAKGADGGGAPAAGRDADRRAPEPAAQRLRDTVP